jgi:hypothetical protein
MPMPSSKERPDLYDYYDNPDPAELERAHERVLRKISRGEVPQYMLDRIAEFEVEKAARAKAAKPADAASEPAEPVEPTAE